MCEISSVELDHHSQIKIAYFASQYEISLRQGFPIRADVHCIDTIHLMTMMEIKVSFVLRE